MATENKQPINDNTGTTKPQGVDELNIDPNQLGSGENRTEFVEINFDEEPASQKASELWKQIRFYALPLFSFVIFLMIIIGSVIPNINGIFATIDDINDLREEDEELDDRIVRLTQLRNDTAQLQEIIDKINEIVPTGKSEVVKFRQRVANTANTQTIILESSSSGEDFIDNDSEQPIPDDDNPFPTPTPEPANLNLIEIPSEFNMRGLFDGFRSMLNLLYEGEDFFVVDEMSLRLAPTEDNPFNWSATINLAKYQFYADRDFNPIAFYSVVSEEVQPNAAVIQFLENRFIRTQEEQTDETTETENTDDTQTDAEPTISPTP